MGQPSAAALKSSEARYRRLFETAQDGILILEADTGRITDVNPFLEAMLGYSHTELLGKALWEIGPVKDIAASQAALRHLQAQEYIRYEDLPLETKDGQRRQVEFVSNVYWVDGWRVIQCNIRDITARKRAEADEWSANADLVAELQQRDRTMQLLLRLNDLLQACPTQADAYQVLARMAPEIFAGQSGALAMAQAPGQHLETVARWGDEALVAASFAWEACWALRRGQLHQAASGQVGWLCRHFVHPPQTDCLCLPLPVQGEALGVLCLSGAGARPGEQQLARMVGEAMRLALSNLKLREDLREQALRDPLTGLFNRRYLQDNLARELYRAERRQTPLCVVMLDLDYFKRFNDTFGHGAGDALLGELGRVLRAHLRQSDIACRYGGEEFVLILPDSALDDTRQRVEQLRGLVTQMQFWHGQQLLGVLTMSAGIAQARAQGESADELLRAADDALYAAKRAGRDRVGLYPLGA